MKKLFVEEDGGDRRGHRRSIPERRQWKQPLGRKVWDCGGCYLWLVSMIKRRKSLGSRRAADGKAEEQEERIRLSKHAALLHDVI